MATWQNCTGSLPQIHIHRHRGARVKKMDTWKVIDDP